ncbi:MAG: diacylglycerol kinase family protein [Merismopediaceae bacterium]|nr:diacylglycerol kinase family protein [Merismopediaceae bacterium]
MKSPLSVSSVTPLPLYPKSSAKTQTHRKMTALPPAHLTHAPQPKAHSRDQAWQIAPDLFTSFRYAWAGIRYAFVTQRNFRIHTLLGSIAFGAGLSLQISTAGLAILALTSALVMGFELINTALESVVDLAVGQSYHELAKITKDCAAGAVLLSAIAAVIIAGCLLVPPLWNLMF